MAYKACSIWTGLKSLGFAKTFLQRFDETLNYEELVFRPTSTLVYRAEGGLICSVLGSGITGWILVLHAFARKAITYNALGWFGH
ncbi:MAG: hypothetical protein CML73_04205 [Rhodobiaceae bacterium]|nr:hypothetical protein [Rhodobiaceae bacterium]